MTASIAQDKTSKPHKPVRREYYLDEPFKPPIGIPESAWKVFLRWTEKENTFRDTELTRSSISATRVNLNDDNRPDLLVTGKIGCLSGADHDWFWLFQNTGKTYRIVLFAGAILVDIKC
jgi:hypothetical protein